MAICTVLNRTIIDSFAPKKGMLSWHKESESGQFHLWSFVFLFDSATATPIKHRYQPATQWPLMPSMFRTSWLPSSTRQWKSNLDIRLGPNLFENASGRKPMRSLMLRGNARRRAKGKSGSGHDGYAKTPSLILQSKEPTRATTQDAF